MTEQVDDVLVVGGGDVGLLTALAVRKLNPGVTVTVVDDFETPVPQVGKSTFMEIQKILHGTLDIPQRRFIEEVKPVWKGSVYFRDWCDCPPFHYPFDPQQKYPSDDTPKAVDHYYYYYDELYRSSDHLTTGERIVEEGVTPWYYGQGGELETYDYVAYHLDSERFNGLLRDVCEGRGVGLVDERVTEVETTGARIDAVYGEETVYEADLYVDATGFSRVLRSEQDVDFREFAFPLDSAYNARVERDLADVVPATVVESGEHGWFWQIDTYDERDVGYVYASEYVDDDAALAEFYDFLESVAPADADPGAADAEQFSFDSGYYERAWVENCLAIGNAEGFVEPLQSTALTANASNAVDFANLLASHARVADGSLRDAYNTAVERMWESISDFVAVHYRYADGDTPFWDAVSSMEVSERVERIAERFDTYGFDWNVETADAADLAELRVFPPPDFYELMRGLGVTSAFYEETDVSVDERVRQAEDEKYDRIREQVEQYYLSYEELYRGVLDA
ncbi:FAD-dependent oxidoreductase [Halarchaeum sp. P4]|uniref:FAD-dependent oxidoreductase n=1 Tax=Halarchaeum sp. P4 TaxID=3421639 RepID=UPI003EBCEA57